MYTPYHPAPSQAIVLPLRRDRYNAVLAYLKDHPGPAWSDVFYDAMADRGMPQHQVDRTVEDLAEEGVVRVRRGVGRFALELVTPGQPTTTALVPTPAPGRFPHTDARLSPGRRRPR